MNQETRVEEKRGAQVEVGRGKGLRITCRDRELLAMMAMARYLSSEQIQQLFFAGRTEAACRIRLFQLASLGKQPQPTPYIRRLRFRSFEGKWFSAWAPTPLGYVVTRAVLGTEPKLPAGDISASFLEHCVRLNDLLVALVATGNAQLPSARNLPFRWLASDSVRLPWRDYDRQAGIHRARIIQPDATLEVPAISKRYFLECEMGTQPLLSEDPSRAGATAHKLDRYSRFMSTYVDTEMKRTAYAVVFPDRWPAQLVFLLNTPMRRDHVRELFVKWGRERTLSISVQALTFDEAIGHFRTQLGSGVPPQKPQITDTIALTRAEYSQLDHFVYSALRRLKKARAQARELENPQLEVPGYPSNSEEVLYLLLPRLSARFKNPAAPAP